MELTDYVRVLRERWLSVALVAFVTVAAVAAVTFAMTPQYTSTTRMFFAVQGGESAADLAQGSSFTERQMDSYAEIARSPLVLEPVIEELGLATDVQSLNESISTSVSAGTTILVISTTHEDPQTAQRVTAAVGEHMAEAVGDINPERADGSDSVTATIISAADLPSSPSSPNTVRNLALGVVLGLLLGVGVAVLREVLDTRVRDEDDVHALTNSAPLAAIPTGKSDRVVFMRNDPRGLQAEAVRRLRTNLQFVDLTDGPSVLLVTSSIGGEGKTVTSINLAIAMSDAGARVLLIDADLRKPSVAKYLGFEGRAGLTTALIGRAQLADLIQPWRDTSLHILASGQIPPNPAELLGSENMVRLLQQVRGAYDVIIIDSPPLLPVTDAAVLSQSVDGVIVVAGADRLHKNVLLTAMESLQKVSARVLGVVLTKVDRKLQPYEYYAAATPSANGRDRSTRSPANSRHAHSPRRARAKRPAAARR